MVDKTDNTETTLDNETIQGILARILELCDNISDLAQDWQELPEYFTGERRKTASDLLSALREAIKALDRAALSAGYLVEL